MNKNNPIKNKGTWRTWLIKKLLSADISEENIIQIIQDNSNKEIQNEKDNIDDINEKELIKNILRLNENSVEDIMVPRAEIISIEKNQNVKEILSIVEDNSHSRMPVYEKNLDNIIGFIHIKDLINNLSNSNFQIDKIVREILYVAPKSPILELLKRMRSSRIHIGLVVDEFGGVDGLITIEDLVEEIVGEIEDEHDAEDNEIKVEKINMSKIVVDASYKINELEKYFQLNIIEAEEEEIDTVGGLVFFIANKIPKDNEIFNYKNQLSFKVLRASERRIDSVEINKLN